MSNNVNKIFIIVLGLLCFLSCKDEKKEIQKKASLYYEKSISASDNDTYNRVYANATDSINSWINNKLKGYANQRLNAGSWRLDSLICFNSKADKCILALLTQAVFWKDTDHDNMDFFYGIKIKNKWYFFQGAGISLPREFYQKDTTKPLSFQIMHEIAMKEIFRGYLKKKDKGFWGNLFGKTEWEINDRFFLELDKPRLPFETRKTAPSYYSCRDINNKKEYVECSLKYEALSVWNEDSTSISKDTYLYSPEFPVTKKIRQLKKGDLLRVIERIDNSQWCYVRMWDGNPNVGFIEKEAIVKREKK
ncbi:hypothetical protein SAMN05444397_101392 [Flavobacterium aquidurense]|nr:hypothetical protein [Flavobacterium frigidimaris]SDY34240.1 hypothetical protein SAMN05444397_101392 [Flavobacterium aquidurense]